MGVVVGSMILAGIWMLSQKQLPTENQDKQNQEENSEKIVEYSEESEDSTSENIIEKEDKELISGEDVQEIMQNTTGEQKETSGEEKVICSNFSRFSGEFVEDGSNELVENVAAVLVTNQSEEFLDFCTLQYEINGKEATFIVTGLPAGRSAWVMEDSRMTIAEEANFSYQGCVTSFRDGVVASTDKISIYSNGNTLIAVNNTQETVKGVFVYYKVLHTDGNFFGGITYSINFGDIEPGKTVQEIAGHYVNGKTEIVRIGWQDS